MTAATGGSTVAFLALTVAYQPWVEYYGARYPGTPGLAGLFLGATDTYYRAFYETFRDLAVTYGVHVAASVNVAPARRVEAADEPDLVARLRDPDEPQRVYAYEAVEGRLVNTLFVFAPDGSVLVADGAGGTARSPADTGGVLRGSLDKAYLTELEQDPLGLSSSAVRALDVLDTPVGRLASVISKDAWMVDVNDRYDAKRPQLVIQAEAFDQWAFSSDFWAPDGFKAGGFAQVQRNPSFLYNLTSCLVGNLFDVTFDGQGAVIGKRHKAASEAAAGQSWIGQDADAGFVAVAPWVAGDPGGDDLAARRASLVASGLPLLPGSGVVCDPPLGPGSCEDGYRESILRVDLDLPAPGALPPSRQPGPREPTAFGPAAFIGPAAGEQRHPRLAAHGDDVYVAWQDSRHGRDAIYLAVSRDGGAHFTTRRVSDHAPGSVNQWRQRCMQPAPPSCASPGRSSASADGDCGRIVAARFDADGNKLGADVRVDRGADAAGKWNAALAVDRGGNPIVAWVDERDASPGGLPLEHVYLARSRDSGLSFGTNARVDRGAPARCRRARQPVGAVDRRAAAVHPRRLGGLPQLSVGRLRHPLARRPLLRPRRARRRRRQRAHPRPPRAGRRCARRRPRRLGRPPAAGPGHGHPLHPQRQRRPPLRTQPPRRRRRAVRQPVASGAGRRRRRRGRRLAGQPPRRQRRLLRPQPRPRRDIRSRRAPGRQRHGPQRTDPPRRRDRSRYPHRLGRVGG
ncbi:MAG: hypothetical protein U0802_21525 [Candidatus Binatia bacterium]